MTQQNLGLSFGLVALLLATQPLHARNMCADRDAVLGKLTGKFGETRRAMGLAANNSIIELHAADDSGTWTITITQPNGKTCMLAAGQAFEALSEDLPAKVGAPT